MQSALTFKLYELSIEFFGELYSLAKGFGPFLRGFEHDAGFREREGSIFSNC